MERGEGVFRSMGVMLRWGLVVGLLGWGLAARGQGAVPAGATEPAVMLSDLHFDPLRDPGKAQRLAKAPVAQWEAIFREPATEHQSEEFAAVQAACGVKLDSNESLVRSGLKAAGEARPEFVTVTGDLLVHDFECRYKAVFHTTEGYTAFAEKTAEFVIRDVAAAFPAAAVYLALGNNDSSCGDYKMDRSDRFLKATSGAVMDGLRGVSAADVGRVRETYEAGGYYSVALAGVARTRMVLLDDIFMSWKYRGCSGEKSTAGAEAELVWLKSELAGMRARGEKAWVIGHIPPGIDVYTTLKDSKGVCPVIPTSFLGDNRIAETLEAYADVVRLGVFAHTHSDEVRLMGTGTNQVAVKLVASVSPINGNLPTFTVAQVERATGELKDYTVFEAAKWSSAAPAWTKEYRFQETYGEKDFSTASVADLLGRFQKNSPGSEAYQTYFAPGMMPVLAVAWPQYVCALDHMTGAEYVGCICGSGR